MYTLLAYTSIGQLRWVLISLLETVDIIAREKWLSRTPTRRNVNPVVIG